MLHFSAAEGGTIDLGTSLKAYRMARRLTQKEMATKLDVSRVHYSRLERGRTRPSIELLERICASTELSVEELFKRKEGTLSRSDLAVMCALCLSLRKEDRRELVRLMKRMLKR